MCGCQKSNPTEAARALVAPCGNKTDQGQQPCFCCNDLSVSCNIDSHCGLQVSLRMHVGTEHISEIVCGIIPKSESSKRLMSHPVGVCVVCTRVHVCVHVCVCVFVCSQDDQDPYDTSFCRSLLANEPLLTSAIKYRAHVWSFQRPAKIRQSMGL